MNDHRTNPATVACGTFAGGCCLLVVLACGLLALPLVWPLLVAFEQGLMGH